MNAGLHIQTVIDLKRYRIYHSRLPGMFNILEQILPTEIAMQVLTYSRHPLADLMTPYYIKHREKMVKWIDFCNRKQRPNQAKNDGFALGFFLDKKFKEGGQKGKSSKEVASENKHMLKLYY